MPDDVYATPVASALSKRAVSQFAENVAQQLGFTPGGDLADILKKLGGRISYAHFSGFGESDSGSLIVNGEGDFEVKLALNTSAYRDRFTIAHEIGHYILHYLLPRKKMPQVSKKMIAERYGSDRTEWEANWFAAAFLMPAEAFHRSLEKNNRDVSKVAEEFGVSVSAARVRAESLGLQVE